MPSTARRLRDAAPSPRVATRPEPAAADAPRAGLDYLVPPRKPATDAELAALAAGRLPDGWKLCRNWECRPGPALAGAFKKRPFKPNRDWQEYCCPEHKREAEKRLRALGNLDPAEIDEALRLRDHVIAQCERQPLLWRLYAKVFDPEGRHRGPPKKSPDG